VSTKHVIYILAAAAGLYLVYLAGKSNQSNSYNNSNTNDALGLNGDGGLLTPAI
jgi:hypothetical protein